MKGKLSKFCGDSKTHLDSFISLDNYVQSRAEDAKHNVP